MDFESLEGAQRRYRIDRDGNQYVVRWCITDTDGTDRLVKVFWSPSLDLAKQYAHRRLVRMGAVRGGATTEREEKLIDLLAQVLPYLEDVAEFHEGVASDSGKARIRKLIRDVRGEVEA